MRVMVEGKLVASWIDSMCRPVWDLQVPQWSRIGRLKRSRMPSLAGGGHTFGGGAGPGMQTVLAGRLLVDTYLAARETVKEVDYSLATLSRSLLSQDRSDLQASSIPGALYCPGSF